MDVPSFEQEAEMKKLDGAIAKLNEALKNPTPEEFAAMAKWEDAMRKAAAGGGVHDFAWFTERKTPDGQKNGDFKYVDDKKHPVREGATVSRRQQGNDIVQHFVINAKDTIKLAAGNTLYAWVYLDPKNPPKTVMLQFNLNGSWEHRAFWGEDKISFGGIGAVDQAQHHRVGDLPNTGAWVKLEATLEQVGLKPGDAINGMAFTQFDGLAYWSDAGAVQSGTGLGADEEAILNVAAGDRDEAQRNKLFDAFRRTGDYKDPRRADLAKLEAERDKLNKSTRKMIETIAVAPREMRVLPRGNWMSDDGEIVTPHVPHFLPQIKVEGDRRATRMDLANWLVSRDNPMTARVFVNRLWAMYFGAGIAKNLDDLGSQGEPPVHPELLDWLAVEFMDRGWDIKHMIKLMVTSSTYRQSSLAPTHLREVDPYNRLLARQSRFRLDAELVRDNALAISGLLVDKIGGDSAKPYQPAGYYRHLNFPKREYQPDRGEGLYRRGVYTHWQRQFLHPMLKAFDAPSRDECAVDRPRSNTPLAALVLLNDPTFVEAARVFSEHALREGGKDDASRLTWMYRHVLSREPEARETQVLEKLLADNRANYTADKDAAKKLVSTGEWPTPNDLDVSEHAAWTTVARAILNMHESITRN
ncbi:MAG: DUF1553 domain-containing protein [Phycisphaera sp.]|nr:DUF1553 domain-containing protein [Phycisphaera sp.]